MRATNRLKPWWSTLAAAVLVFGAGLASHAVASGGTAADIATPPANHHPAASSPFGAGTAPVSFGYDQSIPGEVEPNGTSAEATPIALDGNRAARIEGNIFPNADIDFYSFDGQAGDKVYVAHMTSASSNGSSDTDLQLLASDGVTVIEADAGDGSLGALAPSIAGATLPATGTYYLRVNSTPTGQVRPYIMYLQLRNGTPVPEIEPNDDVATATPVAAGAWVAGAIDSATDLRDFYSFPLNAGDTVYIGLDADPERDGVTWNPRVGLGVFNGSILLVNDASVTSPNSEAFFFTVKDAGTYVLFVDPATAGSGAPTFTYQASVSVFPQVDASASCTVYSSTNVPVVIPPDPPSVTTSTITVPGNPRIADIDVAIELDHTFMGDLDVTLTSPNGGERSIFNDIGAQTTLVMNTVFDDEAAVTPAFTVLSGMRYRPENVYRLAAFDGEDAGGTWTLTLRDDAVGDGGNLTNWSIRICEAPPPPVCPIGTQEVTVYGTDFETDDGGFTSSGTLNEWERGLPSFQQISSCNGGSGNCFVTDLDNTYDASSNQTLRSPVIDLAGLQGPITLHWAQKHQVESASFDTATMTVNDVVNPVSQTLFSWTGATPTATIGSPSFANQESSGWGEFRADLSAFAGEEVDVAFNLTSDTTVQLAGWAIDDFSVTACEQITEADLSITKTDGESTVTPGQTSTYTIVASNAGAGIANGASVADAFPAALTGCAWTCTGAGGGTCAAAGTGDILESVDLPPGGSVTFIATCTVSPSASGSIVNTATVSGPSGFTDPNPANNSATDTNTVDTGPGGADVSLVIVNDRDYVQMGENVSLTVAVQNSGPDAAPAVTISGAVPAELTLFSWTCTALGGATCGAPAGIGSFNTTASLPNGGTVLYAVQGTVNGEDANGSVAFTATAVVEAPVVDPNTANNTDTWDAEVVIFRNGFECTVAGVEGNGGGCAPPPPVTTVLVDEFTNRYQTAPNGGFGDAPVSALQGTLGMTLIGAGAQILNNNSVADDFVVPAGGWTVERMRFYTYQTGSPITSTITDLRLRIFANDPNTGTLVFGDTTTNRLTSTSFTGIYRVTNTTLTNNQRPTMEMVAEFNPPIVLPAGTYWFTWQAGGTLASGPWAPVQTVVGQTTTGNAQQALAGGAYAPLIDAGSTTPQGVPFIIEGLE